MSTLIIAAAVVGGWLVLALLVGTVIGRAVKLADTLATHDPGPRPNRPRCWCGRPVPASSLIADPRASLCAEHD